MPQCQRRRLCLAWRVRRIRGWPASRRSWRLCTRQALQIGVHEKLTMNMVTVFRAYVWVLVPRRLSRRSCSLRDSCVPRNVLTPVSTPLDLSDRITRPAEPLWPDSRVRAGEAARSSAAGRTARYGNPKSHDREATVCRLRSASTRGISGASVVSQTTAIVTLNPGFRMSVRLDSRRDSRGHRIAASNSCGAFICGHVRRGAVPVGQHGFRGREPGVGTNSSGQHVWRRSSSCSFDTSCVEVSLNNNGEVHVRDSKNPSQTQLRFSVGEWAAFLGGVFRGEFDVDRLPKLPTVNEPSPGSPPAAIA